MSDFLSQSAPPTISDIPWREWRDYAAKPMSIVLLGYLSCPPCAAFKAALQDLGPDRLQGWAMGWVALPPREGNALIGQGVLREIPTLLVRGSGDRNGRISGLRHTDKALRDEIMRLTQAVRA